jgi:hypothetical protein
MSLHKHNKLFRKPIPERKWMMEFQAYQDSIPTGETDDYIDCMKEHIREEDYLVAESSVYRGRVHDNPHFAQYEEDEEVWGDAEFKIEGIDYEYMCDCFVDHKLPKEIEFKFEEREGVIWNCTAEDMGSHILVTASVE